MYTHKDSRLENAADNGIGLGGLLNPENCHVTLTLRCGKQAISYSSLTLNEIGIVPVPSLKKYHRENK